MCDPKADSRSVRQALQWTGHSGPTLAKVLEHGGRRVSKFVGEKESVMEARVSVFLAKWQKGKLDTLV